MSDQLLLSWKDHSGALVSVFENLLRKNTLVDCTLAAEGQYLKAHKVVLSACSSYFELLFSQESEKNPIVILKDVKFQELEAAVNFMYRGEVEVCKDRLTEFLEVADSLQIKGLGGNGISQDSKENVSSVKSSCAKSALTQCKESIKEDSNPQSDIAGQNSIVPSDCEPISNHESSSVHQLSRRGSSPFHIVSTFSVESSSCTVKKETRGVSDSFENFQQSLSLPSSFICAESDQCEENSIVKTESENGVFLEDQSDEAERDFVENDDVTMKDEQDDLGESQTETLDVVATNQQGADWIAPDDQQNISMFVKEEPSTLASWNQETVAYDVSASGDGAEPSAGTSSASHGVDSLLNENNEQPTPSSMELITFVAGVNRSDVTGKSTDATAQQIHPRPPFKKIYCPVCKELFTRMIDLEKHSSSKSCGALLSDLEGKIQPAIRQPVRLQKTAPRSLKRSFLKCSECNYVTLYQYHLLRHIRAHTGEKPFKCLHCDYASSSNGNLVRHVRIHTGEKPFKCSHCDYSSSQSGALLKHLSIHTGERPFRCPHCDYASARRGTLLRHIRIHRGQKLFKCTHCDYSFVIREDLVTHLRIHTRKESFKCSQCDYSSLNRGALIMHIRTHTGEKPFKCPHCDYASSQRSNLIIHLRRHTGEKPFKCSHCDYASTKKVYLVTHLRKHTGKKPFKCPRS